MAISQSHIPDGEAPSDRVDEGFVRRAVDQADPTALRMALYQATGDPELAAIRLERPTGGAGTNGSTSIVRIAEEDLRTLNDKAVRFLSDLASDFVETTPDDGQLRTMMEMLRGEPLSDDRFLYLKDVAGFDEFPRSVDWTAGPPEIPDGFLVAIVGAGISGISTAVRLMRLGIPYVIFERRDQLGGTWTINTYPDVRVDTTNFMYQFGFEKNYPWSEYFARQAEVQSYLVHVCEKWGVTDHIRFGCDVTAGLFDESASRWTLTINTVGGETETIPANVVVSCAGLFAQAKELNIDGADEFRGSIVHTTDWPSAPPLDGLNVGVIGNGSTGVQLLACIAEAAEQVTLFQRTPQWIAFRPRYGEPISKETRWLLDTMPYYPNWYVYAMTAEGLGNQLLQEPDPEWQARGGIINEANDAFRETLTNYIHTELADRPDLADKVTPKHAPMARRLIVDNNWYKTLLRDNVELVTDGIERITPRGIRTVDGTERQLDLIVAATGFQTTRYLWPTEYRGTGGVSLEEAWSGDGPRAHLGLTVPGFPNFFVCYGPSAQPRSGSFLSLMEQWATYAVKGVVMLLEGGHRQMDVKREVYEDYNRRLDEQALKLIWVDQASIERNYYVNESGRSLVNEPWQLEQYYAWILAPDPDEFIFA